MNVSTSSLGFLAFAEESHDEEPWDGINLILPDGSELIWAAICFFTLWALLRYVLLPPIVEGRDQRRQALAAGQDSVADSEAELAQLTAAHNERIATAKAEAARIIDAARADADGQRAQAVSAVEEQIAKLRGNAQTDIDASRATALAGVKDSVSELATGAASKVLGGSIDRSASQPMIDAYLSGGN